MQYNRVVVKYNQVTTNNVLSMSGMINGYNIF